MRKVIFALFAFAGLLLGCTSVDCSMNNSVAGVYAFLPARNDSLGNWNDSSLTVVVKGIEGEDTIMNKKAISSNFSLPVSYTQDVDEFRFPLGIAPDGKTIYNKEELKEGTMPTRVSDIFEPSDTMDPKFTISDRMWIGHRNRKERNKQNGKGFGYSLFYADSPYTSTISARYWKDGSEILIDQSDKGLNPRTLTPVEAGRLQGYRIIGNGWEHPECADNQNYNASNPEFRIVVSKKEAYHQFGNSVAIPVIKRLAEEIVIQLM